MYQRSKFPLTQKSDIWFNYLLIVLISYFVNYVFIYISFTKKKQFRIKFAKTRYNIILALDSIIFDSMNMIYQKKKEKKSP